MARELGHLLPHRVLLVLCLHLKRLQRLLVVVLLLLLCHRRTLPLLLLLLLLLLLVVLVLDRPALLHACRELREPVRQQRQATPCLPFLAAAAAAAPCLAAAVDGHEHADRLSSRLRVAPRPPHVERKAPRVDAAAGGAAGVVVDGWRGEELRQQGVVAAAHARALVLEAYLVPVHGQAQLHVRLEPAGGSLLLLLLLLLITAAACAVAATAAAAAAAF